MDIKALILILMGGVLVNNYVLQRFLGICPFLGVSRKFNQASGMGVAVIFVMLCATAVTWPIQTYILNPFGLGYLQTIAFILVIAALVQFVEIALKKLIPALYASLGVYLPLITTNCAVLGTAISTVNSGYDFLQTVLFSFATGIGFLLAIFLLSGIRKKMQGADIPNPFEGFPITLLAAAIMALAFAGFAGITF